MTVRVVAVFTSVFFSCAISVSIATEQGAVTGYFSSFDEDVRLENAYYKVEKAQRLILKTRVNTPVRDVLAISKNIQKAQLMFSGESFEYYLLSIDNNFESTYKQVIANPLTLLVQPDIYLTKQSKPFLIKAGGERSDSRNEPNIDTVKPKGEQVNIAIIDDGIFLDHTALAHITPLFSYDVQSQHLDAQHKTKLDGHGTKIAGVLFAKDVNNKVNGMAADANLIVIRSSNGWTSDTLLSLQLAQLAGADVINCSWDMVVLVEPIADAIRHLAVNGRAGKGAVVVFSAGNDGQKIHASMNSVAANGALLVGALDAAGTPLASSNYGKGVNVWADGEKTITLSKRGKYSVVAATSLAAAKTTGLAANIISSDPTLEVHQVINALKIQVERNKTINNGTARKNND